MAKNEYCVIGLGNPLLSDDAIGLIAVEMARERYLSHLSNVTFIQNTSGGFDLLYDMIGYKGTLIIDSVNTGKKESGFCHEYSLNDIYQCNQPRLIDSHGLNINTICDIGKKCGYIMPEDIRIIGIEGRDFFTFSDTPQQDLIKALDAILSKIETILNSWIKQYMFAV